MSAPITVDGLTKHFGANVAVDDLSFVVRPGAVTGFLGPNGSGKTTTLRMVLGLVRPTRGHSLVLGRPYPQLRQPLRLVGAVLDADGFHPGRSARAHLRILSIANGIDSRRVDEVLALVGLGEVAKRRVGKFSLGMKQRLALASALLGDPDILVLDEPANGLDPEGIRWLREFLRYLAGSGKTVLISSHVLAEVEHTVDDVVIIRRGQLVRAGTLNDVLGERSAGAFVRSPHAAQLAITLRGAPGVAVTEGSDQLTAQGIDPAAVGEIAAREGFVLHELRAAAVSLESVFFELTTDTTPSESTSNT